MLMVVLMERRALDKERQRDQAKEIKHERANCSSLIKYKMNASYTCIGICLLVETDKINETSEREIETEFT